jgi:maleylpyruvate isomerase
VDTATTLALTESHDRLAKLISTLTDDDARAASALPGWSRGHVLTHLAELAGALTRQVTFAMAGRLVDLYDGGRPGRAAAIEAGADRSAAELVDAVTSSSAGLEAAMSTVDDWTRPIRYRDGTLTDVALAWWREVEIHTVDLALGYDHTRWTTDFCHHLIESRADRALTIVTPERTWTVGAGEPVTVRGDLTDVAAWLAGRPHGPVTTSGPAEPPPWP